MTLMTRKAAEAFVDANRGSVISRTDFPGDKWRVTLIAERLAQVWTDLHLTVAIAHRWQGHLFESQVLEFPAIEKRQRRSCKLL